MGTYGADGASGATGYLASKEVALMRRILLLLTVALVMAAMMVASAMPAFAHNAGPCFEGGEPGHSEFARHHVVPVSQSGVPGSERHVPGEHRGYSACNPSGR